LQATIFVLVDIFYLPNFAYFGKTGVFQQPRLISTVLPVCSSSAQNPKSVSPVLGAVLNAAVKICVRASLTPARIDVRDGMRG
ncbi:MAG: hypothetical protein WA320_16740, partial [Candidatus Sulfotelmatobacter sp.]